MSKLQNQESQVQVTAAGLRTVPLKCFVVPYTGSQKEKLCRNISSLKRKQFDLGHKTKQR